MISSMSTASFAIIESFSAHFSQLWGISFVEWFQTKSNLRRLESVDCAM